MPEDVQAAVEKEQVELDSTPGVIIKNEDGSLTKVPPPNAEAPLPDVAPEPTRQGGYFTPFFFFIKKTLSLML